MVNLNFGLVELIQWPFPKLCYATSAMPVLRVFIDFAATGISQVAPFQSALCVEDPERITLQKYGQRLLEKLGSPLSQVPTGGIGIGLPQHTPFKIQIAILWVDIAPLRFAPRWFPWIGGTAFELCCSFTLINMNCTGSIYVVSVAAKAKSVRTQSVVLQSFHCLLGGMVSYAWASVWMGSKCDVGKCQQECRKSEESHGFDWCYFQVLSPLHLNLSHSVAGSIILTYLDHVHSVRNPVESVDTKRQTAWIEFPMRIWRKILVFISKYVCSL